MNVKEDNRERITILSKKDLEFSYFCGSGAGGQARNKVHSGCMIRHPESGAMGRASDSRSLEQNKRSAFTRMVATAQMKFWIAKKLYEIRQQETMEESVEKEMVPKNLLFEVRGEDGRWVEKPSEYFESMQARTGEAP